MKWDRKFWGIEFTSLNDKPMLLGIGWHDEVRDHARYVGEPTRALIFTTRALARDWCAKQKAKYKDSDDICKHWNFKPIRIQEIVQPI